LGANYLLTPLQARVTPDGRHLLFSSIDGAGLTGYDHGSCVSSFGVGCRQLYLYSADSGALACVSCHPSGAPATTMASALSEAIANNGAAQTSWHWNHPLSDDGSRVFFNTGDALVPDDTNGRYDAYEYDVGSKQVHLISSGRSSSHSIFLDASADGDDVFFMTRERLVGWDRDSVYDIYDARVGGGFPEPVSEPICSGDACLGASDSPPPKPVIGTQLLSRGGGNLGGSLRPRKKACKRGFAKKRVRGRRKCVRRKRRPTRRARRLHDAEGRSR
jgi:hypothetical protein